jgi:sigma-B regulation protein RsbQ
MGRARFRAITWEMSAAAIARNNVHVSGVPGGRPMVFAHGFGCDQTVWAGVVPAFENDFATVLFDHVGAGGSDLSAFDPDRYSSLSGYADDVVRLLEELDLRDAVLVGHSVGSMIAALAAIEAPDRVADLVLVAPSPRFTDDPDSGYVGGFTAQDLESLLDALGRNFLGWSSETAPTIMGNADRPELGEDLVNRFCRTDPDIAAHFARVTFTSDTRADLPRVPARALVLQCSDDAIAPDAVGEYVHAAIPHSELVRLRATGHCPHLSDPAETVAAIRAFVDR